jgi:hypothetical protein
VWDAIDQASNGALPPKGYQDEAGRAA